MTNEVRKANLKLDFENGFCLNPDVNNEEALKAVLKALKDGNVSNVKMAVEYNDGPEKEYEEEEVDVEEVEAEEYDDDDDDDDDDEEEDE